MCNTECYLILAASVVALFGFTVLALAPYPSTTTEVWFRGDGGYLRQSSELWSAITVEPNQKSLEVPYTLALYSSLPPPQIVARNLTFSFRLTVSSAFVNAFRLNANSEFVLNWETSGFVYFYIFTQNQYSSWLNENAAPQQPTGGLLSPSSPSSPSHYPSSLSSSDSIFSQSPFTSSSSSSSSLSSSSSVPLSSSKNVNVVKGEEIEEEQFTALSSSSPPSSSSTTKTAHRFQQSGTKGKATYKASKTGLYYLVWQNASPSRVNGSAAVNGSFVVYGEPADPCSNTSECCQTHKKCTVSVSKGSKDVAILSIDPDAPLNSYVLKITRTGRLGLWFSAGVGIFVGLIILFFVIYLAIQRHFSLRMPCSADSFEILDDEPDQSDATPLFAPQKPSSLSDSPSSSSSSPLPSSTSSSPSSSISTGSTGSTEAAEADETPDSLSYSYGGLLQRDDS